jgi:hypothetical protein
VTRWNAWAELRDRTHLELTWAYLTGHAGIIRQLAAGRRQIVLDARLGRRDRHAVLAHELVHDERGVLFDDDTPLGVVRKEEAWVQAETVRRLVPLDELDGLVRAHVTSGGTVSVHEVAEWFDVPDDVAADALRQLQQLVRRRHPSGRQPTAG